MFQKIGLVMNPEKPEAVRMAQKAESILNAHGIETDYPQGRYDHAEKANLILTFGGDGTLLMGARIAMEHDIPLMGINLGTMGFLTEEEPEHLEECLTAILNGNYMMEERFLLRVNVPKTGEEYLALNDAVITRGRFARLIRVDCRVNGEHYGVFTADGMIAATPTGSTGYSLSAGGPIVQPGMQCIVLTPVCAHSLQRCPCIVSGDTRIEICLTENRKQTAELQIDGMDRGQLEAGDAVLVTGSERKISLLRIHPYQFYHVLQNKFVEWGRNER
ncbi:MAG: NAD(+)/NADH kinase [Clostridia bacterium]|nr:NAD(+)/NADH kinase [Clostridia bacterium]